jgi:hypothetical protein
MRLPNTDPTIDISANSGMLRVTVHPGRSWLVVLLGVGGIIIFGIMMYRNWASMSHMFRVLFVWALISGTAALIFQLSGTEIIEIDAQRLIVRKEVHGWERKREYNVEECRELEWMQGVENTPQRLQCKIGWRTVRFGEDLTENQAIEILAALQQSLPDVAQQLCAYPEEKKHFITLGLS